MSRSKRSSGRRTTFAIFRSPAAPPGAISGWFDSARYDIIAKGSSAVASVSESELIKMTDAERNTFRDRLLEKVRTLLADRFQLKVHRETREMPVYALNVAKGGPKLQAPANDDVTRTSPTFEGETQASRRSRAHEYRWRFS